MTFAKPKQFVLVCTLVTLATSVCVAYAIFGANINFDRLISLATTRYGSSGATVMRQWRDMEQNAKNLPRSEQLNQVNDFMNAHIHFSDDRTTWHQSDYWATPIESLGRGAGDCEDYAIAKYFSLLLLGIPVDQLRITYVKAEVGGLGSGEYEAHMVLAYYPDVENEPLILDNLVGEIRPAAKRRDLTPVFGFNSDGIWVGTAKNASSSGSSTSRLSHWRDLIARMHADGFE